MEMRIWRSKIVLFNAALILALGVYGIFTFELLDPRGHAQNFYDDLYYYLSQPVLILNGPSGFIAETISDAFPVSEWLDYKRISYEYGLWLLLLWPQWGLYDNLAKWCSESPVLRTVLYLAIIVTSVDSCLKEWVSDSMNFVMK